MDSDWEERRKRAEVWYRLWQRCVNSGAPTQEQYLQEVIQLFLKQVGYSPGEGMYVVRDNQLIRLRTVPLLDRLSDDGTPTAAPASLERYKHLRLVDETFE